jgi:hypothetical protein
MGKNTSEGDLNAAIAVVKGSPARAALKHAGYSEAMRRIPKKALAGSRMQEAFRRLGKILLDAESADYEQTLRTLENRNADPKLVIETAQRVHDEWEQDGKKETAAFLELPEYSRQLLLGIGSESEDLSLLPVEQISPAIIGQKALQMLWKEMLDPPSDARSRIQVIDRALEVGGFTGKNSELHLHQHGSMPPQVVRMLAEKMAEIIQAKQLLTIDAEIVTDATPN